jgi:hypothetical protein
MTYHGNPLIWLIVFPIHLIDPVLGIASWVLAGIAVAIWNAMVRP